MQLNQQLETLINNASEHGVPPLVVERAIAPILKLFAEQLQHLEYFILQNLEQDWLLSTIASNQSASREKKVIYAFSTLKDAALFQGSQDPNIIAVSLPTTHILFQLFALKQVDSIIFFETPGNLAQGTEIEQKSLSSLIKQQIEQLSQTPPNIA